ncbi:hypothetical protein [Ideonella sp.]|jgi:hypothetical protein|uniref:hypothetical protein n=1 Tax=Ideonella sp. TaxID=1929293 RepID=UPI0037C0689A
MAGSFDDGVTGVLRQDDLDASLLMLHYKNRQWRGELEFANILLQPRTCCIATTSAHEKGDPKIAFGGQAECIGCRL